MKKWLNGELVEMTAEEIAEMEQLSAHQPSEVHQNDALSQMATAMSTASTIAELRAAAKAFLAATEVTNS